MYKLLILYKFLQVLKKIFRTDECALVRCEGKLFQWLQGTHGPILQRSKWSNYGLRRARDCVH